MNIIYILSISLGICFLMLMATAYQLGRKVAQNKRLIELVESHTRQLKKVSDTNWRLMDKQEKLVTVVNEQRKQITSLLLGRKRGLHA